MAHGVTRPVLHVHQALHGYAGGHGLLACSTQLKPRDLKAMLVLSDASGVGLGTSDRGYLTGYPLPESSFYVLARSWPAPEMPRPGCVWTHSLLIDFTDLAAMDCPGELMGMLRRPSGGNFDGYDMALSASRIVDFKRPAPTSVFNIEWARLLLWALYGHASDRLVCPRPADFDVEPLLLEIWAQQWPRLRRTFRFCTLTAGDRSNDGSVFDIQFFPPSDRALRNRFPGTTDIERIDVRNESWLQSAADDLASPAHSLRDFLRRVGGDVEHGRTAFAPLCQLHDLVKELSVRPAALQEAIKLTNRLGTVLGFSARSIVASAAAENLGALDNDSLLFVFMNARQLSDSASVHELGRVLWTRAPLDFWRLASTDPALLEIASAMLASLPSADIIKGLEVADGLIPIALQYKPELVCEAHFWRLKEAPSEAAFKVSASDDDRLQRALDAMIRASRPGLSFEAQRRYGTTAVLAAAIDMLDETQGDAIDSSTLDWIVTTARDVEALARYLSDGRVQTRTSLLAIARATSPDSVPNAYGEDPWVTATRSATGRLSQGGQQYLAAYLLGRALGYRSKSQAELIATSFDVTYEATADSRISDDAWQLVDNRLPRAYFWVDWDRCQRLREGIAETFVDRDLDPAAFGRITQDDQLFHLLVEVVAHRFRGRAFLRSVRDSLGQAGNAGAPRTRLIDRALD